MFWDTFYSECKNKGTSPNAVCASLGLSNATATGWKNGTQPKADVLIKIADFLGVSVDFLLGREPEQKNCTPSATRSAIVKRVESLSDRQAELLLAYLEGLQAESTQDVQGAE